jgi:hypothetical protein
MIHSSTVTFRGKYLTDMVTSVPLYESFSLIKYNTLTSLFFYGMQHIVPMIYLNNDNLALKWNLQ